MLCPTCGSPNEEDSAFCQCCGTGLAQDQASSTPAEPGTLKRLERDATPYVAFSNDEVGLQTDPWLDVQWDKHKNPIPEPLDHGISSSLRYSWLKLSMKGDAESNYREILNTKALSELYVTDSRVILSCKKWEESMIGLVSMVKTAGRVYGGHIRYEWLTEVRFRDEHGLLAFCEIRLSYKDAAGNIYMTEIDTRRRPTTEPANSILAKACRYRLAMNDTKTEEQIAFFTTPVFSQEDKWWVAAIPGSYPASAGQEFRPR